MTERFASLLQEFEDYSHALLGCDPSENEDTQAEFFEIQAWGERIERTAKRHGFTWDQLEDASSV